MPLFSQQLEYVVHSRLPEYYDVNWINEIEYSHLSPFPADLAIHGKTCYR